MILETFAQSYRKKRFGFLRNVPNAHKDHHMTWSLLPDYETFRVHPTKYGENSDENILH